MFDIFCDIWAKLSGARVTKGCVGYANMEELVFEESFAKFKTW